MTCVDCKYYKNGYCKLWESFVKANESCEDGEEE